MDPVGIQPGDQDALEKIARYAVRASFSRERMTYGPDEAKVISPHLIS
jgi:hypothetical protein